MFYAKSTNFAAPFTVFLQNVCICGRILTLNNSTKLDCRGLPKATVIRMYRSFTRLITNPIVLMQIIGNRQLIGKKLMEREGIGRIRIVFLND